MNEIENEDLVFTLETIVDKFGEEMAPYALGLCQNLVIYILKHLNLPKELCLLYNIVIFFLTTGSCILEVHEHRRS